MIALNVTPEHIAAAEALRLERDRQFGGYQAYPIHGYETRWAGDLGEGRACYWFGRECVPARWYKRQPAGQCDFRVRRAEVELKTACYTHPPRAADWVGLGAARARRIQCDFYLFMIYNEDDARIWVAGAIERNRLCYYARKIPKGARVPGWKADALEDRLEIQLGQLTPPRTWLRQLETDWGIAV